MVLNDKLYGRALEQVKQATILEIYEELSSYKTTVSRVLEMMKHLLDSQLSEKVYLGGTLNIFNQPEFKDIDKLKSLLGVLEQEAILKDLLGVNLPSGLSVRIGGENKHEAIANCSLITATYQVNNDVMGSIGILGPTRMPYSKAISLVECVTSHLSNTLTRLMK